MKHIQKEIYFVPLIVIVIMLFATTGCQQNKYVECERYKSLPSSLKMPAICYKNDCDAVSNGQRVLALLERSSEKEEFDMKDFLGMKVAFAGNASPPGNSANLITQNDILIYVDIDPYEDVRPIAAEWVACVYGEIQYIDINRGILYITAKPNDWVAISTF